jgi:Lon protease-like protein
VRWLQRVERLLALSNWRMEQDYRRAAEWVAQRLASAAPAQEKGKEREADAATAGEAKAAKRGFTRLLKFGRLKR